MPQLPALLPLLSKLERLSDLNDTAREAILDLPHNTRRVAAGCYVLREGDVTRNCHVLVSGIACRHKVTASGLRQILSFHVRGDPLDAQQAWMPASDHSIQALTPVQVVVIPQSAVTELMAAHPDAARALWLDILLDAAIQREWTTNIGRRDARTRIAHILCELGIRMEACGLGTRTHYDLPITQEQLADAAGLTSVHVNRVLQSLRADGLISGKSPLQINDWDQMTEVGDFRLNYMEPLAA